MQAEHATIKKSVDPARQCQCVLARGQCINEAVPGGKYCMSHGGAGVVKAQQAEALNNYRLQKYNSRLRELRSSSAIKDLRDEVGILRLILEEKFNSFQSSTDLILQSGSIGDLIMKIERLVTSCHKLDEKMGLVVDKSEVTAIADQLIACVGKHVNNADILEKIAGEFSEIMGLHNPSNGKQ